MRSSLSSTSIELSDSRLTTPCYVCDLSGVRALERLEPTAHIFILTAVHRDRPETELLRNAIGFIVARDCPALATWLSWLAKLPRRLINPRMTAHACPSVDFSGSPGAHVLHTLPTNYLKNLDSRSDPSSAQRRSDAIAY